MTRPLPLPHTPTLLWFGRTVSLPQPQRPNSRVHHRAWVPRVEEGRRWVCALGLGRKRACPPDTQPRGQGGNCLPDLSR